MTILVANPPAGIYRGDINPGQAAYHVWLDFYVREKINRGQSVICPRFSLNALGKRATSLQGAGTAIERGRRSLGEYLLKNRRRDRLNLFYEDDMIDDQERVKTEIVRQVRALYSKGYLIKDGKELFLDCGKIKKTRNLESVCSDIQFFPPRLSNEFIRLIIENTTDPVRITRDVEYSFPVCSDMSNIGPLFVLANCWNIFSAEEVILPFSNNTLAKYVFLRFLTQMALTNTPGFNSLYAYPRVDFDEAIKHEFEDMPDDLFQIDMFRYACAKSHSLYSQRTQMSIDMLKGGRRLIHLIANLRRIFTYVGCEMPIGTLDDGEILEFNFRRAVDLLENEFRDLSRKVNEIDKISQVNRPNADLCAHYRKLLSRAQPLFPETVNLCYKTMGVGNE